MLSNEELGAFLEGAQVAPEVFELRGDYRAMLIAAEGMVPGAGDQVSEALLRAAEAAAREALRAGTPEELAHVAAWREAYRAFGAKPQRTRNSLEALLRRCETGLPRVNRLTDIYNAVSLLHQVPVGGEDLRRYAGPPRLVRAAGNETFDTVAGGETVVEHPDPGEVVWRDEAGVTCRRWNWRQAHRTRLREDTTTAFFVIDALGPISDQALRDAGDALIGLVSALGPEVRVAHRIIANTTEQGE
ncbi:MAG: phenylalanine--tRNA ligase beta subunit-related protein [Actinomycetota bacterium]|nr:phenylalanine--tRNA ligase beta subunit-related protein [Actinomycetota bacterium]